MEPQTTQSVKEEKVEKEARHLVHHTLAHSYTVYFFVLLFGVALDMFFPFRIFPAWVSGWVGMSMLVLAPILIIWAQQSSRQLAKTEEATVAHFCKGPYCYTRTPTHWGLFFLVLGFGLMINAFFITTLTLISFIITKLVFIKDQETILEHRYGDVYKEYKKKVHF
ncbi:MAG: methyltransferase family protein [Candidatus Paceibacterota bacterium]